MQRMLILGACCLILWAGHSGAHEDPSDQIAHLSHHLLEHPDNPTLYLQRGELYRLAGDWPAADTDYRMAQSLDADAARVAVCRAALELDRGNPEGALDLLLTVTEAESSTLFIRGRALRQLGRIGEAAAVLEQAVAAAPRPRPEDYLELTEVVLEQGDRHIPEAVALLDAGSRRLGPVVALTLAAVDLEARCGQYAAVLDRLDAAPPVLRNTPAWMTRRGEILRQAERELEAQAAFTEALSALHALPAHRQSIPAHRSLEKILRAYLSTTDPNTSGDSP